MRISDWSSDVCSSDLTLADAAGATDAVEAHWCAGAGVPDQQRAWRNRDGGRDTAPEQTERDARRGENPPLRRDVAAKISHCRSDRKSVVSGTSVSVGVDLGCRRSNKKKNNKQQ